MSDERRAMSPAAPLARLQRAGGRPPADDEALEIAADGSFTAIRTVSGTRAGRFAGRLPAATVKALQRDVAAVADGPDVVHPTPRDGATEVVEAAGHSIRMGSNDPAPPPWRPLVRRLRELAEERVLRDPVAAVELQAGRDGVALVHAGSEGLRLDPTTLGGELIRAGADGVPLERRPIAAGSGDVVRVDAGWRLDLAAGEPLEFRAGERLIARVEVEIDHDGRFRLVSLYADVVPGG